jgi:cytochrome c oxidase subunit IV
MTSESHEVAHDIATHPGRKTYVMIGVYLAVLTAIEIALYYLEIWHIVPRGFAVPALIFLSTIKFILVVQFYMHLKFDSKVFTGIFVFPALLGTLVILALFMLYHLLPLVN